MADFDYDAIKGKPEGKSYFYTDPKTKTKYDVTIKFDKTDTSWKLTAVDLSFNQVILSGVPPFNKGLICNKKDDAACKTDILKKIGDWKLVPKSTATFLYQREGGEGVTHTITVEELADGSLRLTSKDTFPGKWFDSTGKNKVKTQTIPSMTLEQFRVTYIDQKTPFLERVFREVTAPTPAPALKKKATASKIVVTPDPSEDNRKTVTFLGIEYPDVYMTADISGNKGLIYQSQKSLVDALFISHLAATNPSKYQAILQAVINDECTTDMPVITKTTCKPMRQWIRELMILYLNKMEEIEAATKSAVAAATPTTTSPSASSSSGKGGPSPPPPPPPPSPSKKPISIKITIPTAALDTFLTNNPTP